MNMKDLNNKKINYLKLYHNSNSWFFKKSIKYFVKFVYLRRYFVNFYADALKILLYWWALYGFFFLPVLSFMFFWV